MIQRLRDMTDCEEPAVVELIDLVRSTGDLDPPLGAQERVRRALLRPQPQPQRSRFLQPLMVALALAVVVPVAVASVHRLTRPRLPRPPAPRIEHALPPPRLLPRPVPAPEPILTVVPEAVWTAPSISDDDSIYLVPQPEIPVRVAPAAPEPEIAVPAASELPAAPIADAPSGSGSSPEFRDPASDRRTAPPVLGAPRMPAPPPAPTPRPEEAALVLGALHSLRHDHDAHGALHQLDAYRSRFPDGDLVEEALALMIEARAALDDREAGPLAAQYIQRYPNGRFREAAERALRRFAPH